jgi:hypothetical protein
MLDKEQKERKRERAAPLSWSSAFPLIPLFTYIRFSLYILSIQRLPDRLLRPFLLYSVVSLPVPNTKLNEVCFHVSCNPCPAGSPSCLSRRYLEPLFYPDCASTTRTHPHPATRKYELTLRLRATMGATMTKQMGKEMGPFFSRHECSDARLYIYVPSTISIPCHHEPGFPAILDRDPVLD